MNKGKYVFAQLIDFMPRRIFDRLVKKYNGNKYAKHFKCWNQLLTMMFGQISSRESLRDLILTINAHSNKFYHLGFGKSVTRSNLAKANQNRSSLIFEEFAYCLIEIAQSKNIGHKFSTSSKIFAFDSTTIDLCLNVFWWAEFRRNKAGIKLHTLYDVSTQIPVFIHVSEAKLHDVNAMDIIPYETGAYYIFDRAYVDFERLFIITKLSAFFLVRAKTNLKFRRIYSNKKDKSTGVIFDQIGKLTGFNTSKQYPEKVRKIKYYDKESKRKFIFLTNNFELSALEIAKLYKKRWQVELFFKWIKQHLKIKSFWGTTENAVRIQIYIAIITYCLVAIVKHELRLDKSNYEILQILGISLLDKTPIKELLIKQNYNNFKELNSKQLKINLI